MLLFSWTVVGLVVAALVVAGAGVLIQRPPRSYLAQLCFTAAAVLLSARAGWWLVRETRDVSTGSRVIVGLAVAGVTAAWWIGAVRWARRR